MKRSLNLVLCLALLGVGTARAAPFSTSESLPFKDISSHWAKDDIVAAVSEHYVDGMPGGLFEPDRSITKAEFVKMVVTALKFKTKEEGIEDTWYKPYVNAAVANGIHQTDEFSSSEQMNSAISREEMARIAVRATGEANYDSKKWMYLATSKGIIQGLDEKGTLGETQDTTRAQAIKVIERIKTVRSGVKIALDQSAFYAISNAELAWHKTNIFTVMPEFFGKLLSGTSWNPDDLYVETPDGKYRGEMDALIAIDLADPNDPNLWQIPDISTLKWYNLGNGKGFPITDFKDSYLLYFKAHTVYNHDTSIYVGHSLDWAIYGFKDPDFDAFQKGTLNSIASIMKDKPFDVPAFIIPKKGLETKSLIRLDIYAPAIAPNPTYDKTIVRALVPAKIE